MDGLILKQQITDSFTRYTLIVNGKQKALHNCTIDVARLTFAKFGSSYKKSPMLKGIVKQEYI